MTRRVLVLTHQDFDYQAGVEDLPDQQFMALRTEYDVAVSLEQLGHSVETLTIREELGDLRRYLRDSQPDIVFNLMEEFRGEGFYVPFVLGYLELMRRPFTGCNPSGLMLADNKPLAKKIMRHHRIPVPDWVVIPRRSGGRRRLVKRPPRMEFPLIVKSATEHGSMGIAQASVVYNDEKLDERVAFVHETLSTDAIAERFIEGREFYVGVIGNRRLQTLPTWELSFKKAPDGQPLIATEKAKWDVKYQEKVGVDSGPAQDLPKELEERLIRFCKRVYRILELNGYARMDFRITDDERVYLLEPNPNPDLALEEDFAAAALETGMSHPELIQKILNLGFGRKR